MDPRGDVDFLGTLGEVMGDFLDKGDVGAETTEKENNVAQLMIQGFHIVIIFGKIQCKNNKQEPYQSLSK